MIPQLSFDTIPHVFDNCTDALQLFHQYPLTIPWISFDNSWDELQITHVANPHISYSGD